jgi:hypothetical protein
MWHFIKITKLSVDDPVCLILDGCYSHVSYLQVVNGRMQPELRIINASHHHYRKFTHKLNQLTLCLWLPSGSVIQLKLKIGWMHIQSGMPAVTMFEV